MTFPNFFVADVPMKKNCFTTFREIFRVGKIAHTLEGKGTVTLSIIYDIYKSILW